MQCPICAERSKNYQALQARFIERGEAELERFRQVYEAGVADFRPSPHCDMRQLERDFYWREVVSAVLEGGEVIERRVERLWSGASLVVLLISSYIQRSGEWRPIHVVVQFDPVYPAEWLVRTAYNPADAPKRWWASEHYTVRHCWCPLEEEV